MLAHEWLQREPQLEDPVGGIHGPRIPERQQFRDGDLLPLREARHDPFTRLKAGRLGKRERSSISKELRPLSFSH
jgi:hypothetical protein